MNQDDVILVLRDGPKTVPEIQEALEPGLKGDTASSNALKPATVETGATIKVPLFINTGERIRVDTRTREYYERIK